MPYTPPNGNAANFVALGYYEPGKIRHAFQFGVDYTAPAADAAHFVLPSWVYPTPLGSNIVVPANINVVGIGAFSVEFTVEGHGEFTNVQIDGAGAFTVEFGVAGVGAHGEAGSCAFAVGFTPAGVGAHGVAGAGAVDLAFGIAGVGIVERYELTGEVRKDGILVNRLVRAYRRDTGELVGEMATTGGKFKVPCGFVSREHYIVPIDTANDAVDWLPPVANRVASVLAQDAA